MKKFALVTMFVFFSLVFGISVSHTWYESDLILGRHDLDLFPVRSSRPNKAEWAVWTAFQEC